MGGLCLLSRLRTFPAFSLARPAGRALPQSESLDGGAECVADAFFVGNESADTESLLCLMDDGSVLVLHTKRAVPLDLPQVAEDRLRKEPWAIAVKRQRHRDEGKEESLKSSLV